MLQYSSYNPAELFVDGGFARVVGRPACITVARTMSTRCGPRALIRTRGNGASSPSSPLVSRAAPSRCATKIGDVVRYFASRRTWFRTLAEVFKKCTRHSFNGPCPETENMVVLGCSLAGPTGALTRIGKTATMGFDNSDYHRRLMRDDPPSRPIQSDAPGHFFRPTGGRRAVKES